MANFEAAGYAISLDRPLRNGGSWYDGRLGGSHAGGLMSCTVVRLPEVSPSSAIDRSASRCACGAVADLRCDWKVPGKKSGTCDRWICERCTTAPAPVKDLCPEHAEAWRAWQARRAAEVERPHRLWRPARRYSVDEIDEMRTSVSTLVAMSNRHDHGARDKRTEEQLRTYMLNGTTPAELGM